MRFKLESAYVLFLREQVQDIVPMVPDQSGSLLDVPFLSHRELGEGCFTVTYLVGLPLISPFWQKVFTSYNSKFISNTKASPAVALLLMIPGAISKVKKSILRHSLLAAHTAITPLSPTISQHWKSTSPPHFMGMGPDT